MLKQLSMAIWMNIRMRFADIVERTDDTEWQTTFHFQFDIE